MGNNMYLSWELELGRCILRDRRWETSNGGEKVVVCGRLHVEKVARWRGLQLA
jgi:hypothetical protein